MQLHEFWRHIECARQSSPRIADVPAALELRLSQLSDDQILGFSRHLRNCMDRADDGCLWVAACIIRRGCSDDSFDYFIGWLIAQGHDVFERALANPDSLADLESFEGKGEMAQLEAILSADVTAYMMKTGSDDFEFLRQGNRCGTRNRDFLRLSDAERGELFPKLTARFAAHNDRYETGHL